MLQQTQTSRVIEKFNKFILCYPSINQLASSSTKDLLTQWQGLGYNRRALNLQKSAKIIVEKYHGLFPNQPQSSKLFLELARPLPLLFLFMPIISHIFLLKPILEPFISISFLKIKWMFQIRKFYRLSKKRLTLPIPGVVLRFN